MDPNFTPGSFGCHEALHVAYMLGEMVERYLVDHPSIQQDPAWLAKATLAMNTLGDLYQSIGEHH